MDKEYKEKNKQYIELMNPLWSFPETLSLNQTTSKINKTICFKFEDNITYTAEQLQELFFEFFNRVIALYNWNKLEVGDIIYTSHCTLNLFRNFKVKTITEDKIILTDLI